MGCREREVDERVILGLEIGGELARLGGVEYSEAEKFNTYPVWVNTPGVGKE